MERENLAGDAKGKDTSGYNRKVESTDAPERGFCRTGRDLRGVATAVFWRRALLLRIQSKHFELPFPFCRSIAQPFDVDAPR